MSAVELILRAVGVIQLALLAALMLRARRHDQTALIGAMLCISVGAFLLTSAANAEKLFGPAILPLTAVCSTHPVWFWLFAAALFADGFRLTRWHLTCVVGMALVGVVYQSLLPAQIESAWFGQAFGVIVGGAALALAGLAPLTVFVGAQADLDERRRRIRTWFVPLSTLYLAVVTVVQVLSTLAMRPTPEPLVVANLALIDAFATVGVLTFVQIRIVNWLDLIEPAHNPEALSRVERGVLERLGQRLVSERLYAREALTIARLAELLDAQEHVLRRVVNRGLGYRNFNDFLHAYRLSEAAARLHDPAERRVPVLTIALEAGYGSIGPFNRAFKARFGVTPTEFRRSGARPERIATALPTGFSTSHPA